MHACAVCDPFSCVMLAEEKENCDMKNSVKGIGHLRKRENGVWEGQYLYDGVRKSIYGSDYSKVRSRLNDICTALLNNCYVEVSLTTLGEWLVFWLEHYSKPVTRQSSQNLLADIAFLKLDKVKLVTTAPDVESTTTRCCWTGSSLFWLQETPG
jgi:hypothetical protein